MPETGIAERLVRKIKRERKTPAPPSESTVNPRSEVPHPSEEWFQAFILGNAAMPQKGTAIMINLLAAVLEFPPEDLGDFGYSELSNKQIQRAEELMTKAHRERGVRRAAKGVVEEGEMAVDPIRLYSLWIGFRNTVFKSLFYYASPDSFPIYDVTPINVQIVNEFSKKGGFDGLKKSAVSARDALRSPELKDMLGRYRSLVVSSYDSTAELRRTISDQIRSSIPAGPKELSALREVIG